MLPDSRHDMLLLAMRDSIGELATAIEESIIDGRGNAGDVGGDGEDGAMETGEGDEGMDDDQGAPESGEDGNGSEGEPRDAAGGEEGGEVDGGSDGENEGPSDALQASTQRRHSETLEKLREAVRPVAMSLVDRFFDNIERVEGDVLGVIDGRLQDISEGIKIRTGSDSSSDAGGEPSLSDLTWSAFSLERVKHKLLVDLD